jgi:hypothetical protein
MPTSSASLHPFVYLASQSPRRHELLQQLGVRFELLLPRPDEDAEALEAERPGEPARDYVQRVCIAKAHAARTRRGRSSSPTPPSRSTMRFSASPSMPTTPLPCSRASRAARTKC